jgi:O-glycosyl hydrolase
MKTVAKLQVDKLFLAQQPPAGKGLFIHEVSRSHRDATQSVGLLWTSDQLVAETST